MATNRVHIEMKQLERATEAQLLARAKALGGNCESCDNSLDKIDRLYCSPKLKSVKHYNVCHLYEVTV